jgi:predicted GNAT family acetyltransferase
MGKILAPGEYAALFLTEPAKPPKSWSVVREFEMDQMICDVKPALPKNDAPVEVLGPEAVNEMKALAELTKPGPFDVRTIEFGGFVGVRDHGRLVAMAGQRTRPKGFTEVSAVCTHPDARGRGLAELLVARVTRGVFERGEIPFLELKTGNAAARRVYEKLGYRFRRNLIFSAVRPDIGTIVA